MPILSIILLPPPFGTPPVPVNSSSHAPPSYLLFNLTGNFTNRTNTTNSTKPSSANKSIVNFAITVISIINFIWFMA